MIDGQLITARKIGTARGDSKIEDSIDLGFVGEPESVDTTVIDALIKAMIIPVIAPVASDQSHATYNINADTAAGANCLNDGSQPPDHADRCQRCPRQGRPTDPAT